MRPSYNNFQSYILKVILRIMLWTSTGWTT